MRWALVFPVVLAVASCDEADVHILSGQLYVPGSDCIEPSQGVDVVEGASTGDSCGAQCLTIAEGDASVTYITNDCPPYPGDYTVESADATAGDGDPCVGAFAAYENDAAVCPPDLGDGGTDAASDANDAASDASDSASEAAPGDAGTEAAADAAESD